MDLKRGWITDREGHDARMHEAAKRIAEFDATATSVLTYGTGGVDVGGVFTGLADLFKVIEDLINDENKRDKALREEIIQGFNDLRWKKFDDL